MKKLGKYEIIEKIGEGGMGTVYKAKQPTLNKVVALKILADACAKDDDLVQRFMREAHIMASLPDYNHVVQVFDLDEVEGKYFYTMEYIPLSLAEYIGDTQDDMDQTRKVKRASKIISVETTIRITRHILEGLKVIHKADVIHRDISPQNILIVKEQDEITAKITDFGIAGVKDSGLTKTGMGGIGKEIYVAPEQWESLSRSDARSDIYSLGILMYRMITGRLPGGTKPKEPIELNPKVGKVLNTIILRATEELLEKRYQSAGEMLDVLEQVAGGELWVGPPHKQSPANDRKAARVGKPVYPLRSKPITVSKNEFEKAFGLDDDGKPREYVQNEFEDNSDGTVSDHATGLMWQKSGSGGPLNYGKAKGYISKLNQKQFAGYSNWRLPTIEELISLLELDKQSCGLYINSIFDKKQYWCWSASERSPYSVWLVYFNYGLVRSNISRNVWVRAVRSGQ